MADIAIWHKHHRVGQPAKPEEPHRHRLSTPIPKQKQHVYARTRRAEIVCLTEKKFIFTRNQDEIKLFFSSRKDFSRFFFHNSFRKKPLCGSTIERRKQEEQYREAHFFWQEPAIATLLFEKKYRERDRSFIFAGDKLDRGSKSRRCKEETRDLAEYYPEWCPSRRATSCRSLGG